MSSRSDLVTVSSLFLACTAASASASTASRPLVGGSDDCTTADAIAGVGTFAVDTTVATSGSPLGSCGSIGNDVWFRWTAPSTGVALVSTCATVAADSVIAVWADAGLGNCPVTQIACLDDVCGLQTQVSFAVTAGTAYVLELGGFSGATYAGSFGISIGAPSPNDECVSAIAIAGAGPHPFDTTGATTGVDGQAEAICLANGSTAIERDVWFEWTAAFTGVVRLDLCGLTADDTKVAVHGGACPPSGTALSCNDDACGIVSSLSFDAVVGNSYRIQLGVRPGLGDAIGFFTLTACPAPPNDNAGSPATVVNNRGTFDNRCGTSTTPTGCTQPPPGVRKGVFHTWNAGGDNAGCSSRTFRVRTRSPDNGMQDADSVGGRIVVPGGLAYCGGMSLDGAGAMVFTAPIVDGVLLEFGAADPDESEGTAVFCIQCCDSCGLHDGTSELGIGVGTSGESGWLQTCGGPGFSWTVNGVRLAWGSATNPGAAPTNGSPARIAVWEDPNDDGDPADAVLVTQDVVSVASAGTDALVPYSFSAPAMVSGVYFVGAAIAQLPGGEPTPIDNATCGRFPTQSYLFGQVSVPADLVNLNGNSTPPTSITPGPNEGVILIESDSTLMGGGIPFCFGDGSGTACPCGNIGGAGNGCASSTNPAGANLASSGVASLGSDTLVLQGTGMPSTSQCLYFQGTLQISVVFGDGLRCAGGSVVRLGTKANSGGASQYPAGLDLPISVKGLVGAPGARTYQAWYRNAAAFCTASTFNLTNGIAVNWIP